jgi:DNA-binding transcriptional regulator YiaG
MGEDAGAGGGRSRLGVIGYCLHSIRRHVGLSIHNFYFFLYSRKKLAKAWEQMWKRPHGIGRAQYLQVHGCLLQT